MEAIGTRVAELGATGVFLNQAMLRGAQHAALAQAWRCPIFDRHSVVLQALFPALGSENRGCKCWCRFSRPTQGRTWPVSK